MRGLIRLSAILFTAGLCMPASAQPQDETIQFAGGTLTISETDDYERVVSFNGEEVGRDYQVFFDRIANVGGTEVALISVGPGGNACGANTLLVWPDGEGGVNSDKLPGDCGWAPPSVSDYGVVFVPWSGPGEELPVQRWNPESGFRTAGILRFAPDPGTVWTDLAAAPELHPLDYFSNEEFFTAAVPVLGDDLAEYATGLRVSSEMQELGGGFFGAIGCVPHNCGGADSVLVVDPAAKTAWYAQFRGDDVVQWPPAAQWPQQATEALRRLRDY